jgi:hypothetical protein
MSAGLRNALAQKKINFLNELEPAAVKGINF